MIITGDGGLDNWYNVTVNTSLNTFEVNFNHKSPARQLNFFEAADYTARTIAEKYKDIFLGLSGGMDSQFVAETLYKNNINFTPLIGMNPTNNDHEFAIDWCNARNIKSIILDLEFYSRDILKIYTTFLKKVPFVNVGNCIDLFLSSIAKKHSGHLLVGGPTLPLTHYHPTQASKEPIYSVDISEFALELTNQPIGGFFFFTPEIALSQAINLDITKTDDYSRAALYNFPVRHKTLEYRLFPDSIRLKLAHITKNRKINNQDWSKTNLINLLQN